MNLSSRKNMCNNNESPLKAHAEFSRKVLLEEDFSGRFKTVLKLSRYFVLCKNRVRLGIL